MGLAGLFSFPESPGVFRHLRRRGFYPLLDDGGADLLHNAADLIAVLPDAVDPLPGIVCPLIAQDPLRQDGHVEATA